MPFPFLEALMKIIVPQDFEIPEFIREASATLGKQSLWEGLPIESILCTFQGSKGKNQMFPQLL